MPSWPYLILSSLLASLCGGCCTSNCGISDLAFISLEHPKLTEIRDQNATRDYYRVAFKPGDLKLRFSTKANLFELQDRNGTQYPTVSVNRCGDKAGIVAIAPVYTDDGWATDKMQYFGEYIQGGVKKRAATVPLEPIPKPNATGLFKYQVSIKLNSVMYEVKTQYGLGGKFVDLPHDPFLLPDFCFVLDSSGPIFSFSSFRSNEVRLPREAVIGALVNPSSVPP